MPNGSSRNRNFSFILAIYAVLALGALGYFYFYVQNREDDLHRRHERVLYRVHNNILLSNRNYQENARNNAAKNLEDLKRQARNIFQKEWNDVQVQVEELLRKLIQANASKVNAELAKAGLQESDSSGGELARQITFPEYMPISEGDVEFSQSDGFRIQEEKKEDYYQTVNKASPGSDRIELNVFINEEDPGGRKSDRQAQREEVRLSFSNAGGDQRVDETIRDLKNAIAQASTSLSLDQFRDTYQKESNLNYVIIPESSDSTFPEGFRLEPGGETGWDVNFFGKVNDSTFFSISRNLEKVITPALREGVFDEFIVFGVPLAEVSEDPKRKDYFTESVAIFQTYGDNFYSNRIGDTIDTLIREGNTGLKDHTIPGVPYQVYLKPLTFSRDQRLVLCGLVDAKRFSTEKTRIPATLILVIVLVTLFIFFSLPTLKLLLMSRIEQLEIRDVYLSFFGILLVTALLVLASLDLFQFFFVDREKEKEHLEDLNEEIREALFEEIDSIYTQLGDYEKVFALGLVKDTSITDILRPDVRFRYEKIRSAYYNLKPRIYPYFRSVYLTDPRDESIRKELTVREIPTPQDITLTGRQYLEQFKLGRGWKFPDTTEREYVLESILSRSTGEQLAAVSKKYDPGTSPSDRPSAQTGDVSVIFMTIKLTSLIRPLLPQGFGFCVIDSKGEVQFHSKLAKNLQENFLEECNSRALRSAMVSRAGLHFGGSYTGIPHRFYVSPIENSPLFLVTFREESFHRIPHIQAISQTYVLSLILFSLGLLVWGIMYAFRQPDWVKKAYVQVIDWIRPLQFKRGAYMELTFFNLLTLALLVFASFSTPPLYMIYLLLLANFSVLVAAYYFLSQDASLDFSWKGNRRFMLGFGVLGITLLALFAPVWYLQADTPPLQVTLAIPSIAILVGLVLSGNFRLGKWVLRSGLPEKGNPLRFVGVNQTFRWFFITWLGISCLFPVVKFYQFTLEHEKVLLLKRSQINLLNDYAERNQWIYQRYKEVAESKEVRNNLATKGIHSKFYGGSVLRTKVRYQYEKDSLAPWGWKVYSPSNSLIFPAEGKHFGPYRTDRELYRSLSTIRPIFNELIRETNRLHVSNNQDSTWIWVEGPDSLYFLDRSRDLFIASKLLPTFTFPTRPDNFYTYLFWLGMVVLLYLVYRLVDFHIGRLFSQSLLVKIDLPPRRNKRVLLETRESVFLVVPPSPLYRDFQYVLEWKAERAGYPNFREEDIISLKDVTREGFPEGDKLSGRLDEWRKLPFLVLNHLDRALDTPGNRKKCLNFIKRLREEMPRKQLFLVSAYSQMEQEGLLLDVGPPPESGDARITEMENLDLLTQFTKVVYPLDFWRFLYDLNRLERFCSRSGPFLFYVDDENLNEAARDVVEEAHEMAEEPEQLNKGREIIQVFNQPLILDKNDLKKNFSALDRKLKKLITLADKQEDYTIVTNVTPAELYKYYEEALAQTQDPKEEEKLRTDLAIWRKRLSLTIKGIYFPHYYLADARQKVRNRLIKECAQSPYLQVMQQELLDRYCTPGTTEQDVIELVESRAKLYYRSLWSSCGEEEHYMIFDLAKDGVVNGKNKEVFDGLARKGIIIVSDKSPSIMNKSFRNFVRTSIRPEEALRLLDKQKKEGNWNRFRFPIAVIIIALGGFLVFTQREFLNETMALIGGLAVVVPVLQRLFESLSNLNTSFSSLLDPILNLFRRQPKGDASGK